ALPPLQGHPLGRCRLRGGALGVGSAPPAALGRRPGGPPGEVAAPTSPVAGRYAPAMAGSWVLADGRVAEGATERQRSARARARPGWRQTTQRVVLALPVLWI